MSSIVNCVDIEPALAAYLSFGAELSVEASAHVRECDLCRQRCADAALTRLLLSHDVPPPRPGFVDEAIRNAIDHHTGAVTHRPRRLWVGAIAASLVACSVAIGLLVHTNANLGSVEPGVQIALVPEESKTVRVLIDSIANRDRARITIALGNNLELEGFPGDRVIEWETSLKEGKNLLALPLRLKDGADSHFEVAFTDGTMRKRLKVNVAVDNSPTTHRAI